LNALINKILNSEELIKQPPVLVDIGSSGKLNRDWKQIADKSICIAFDADDRDIGYLEKKDSEYYKLYLYNAIVVEKVDKKNPQKPFYLTKSPHCSSLLEPYTEKLQSWIYADLFTVDKKVELNTIDLPTMLKELKIDRIDWFKTDSQGTDLRLFKSLGDKIINRILIAEFEPGILDSYKGEDKLFTIIEYMDQKNFWMSDLKVRGTQRISHKNCKQIFSDKEIEMVQQILKCSPGWGEITYFNNFIGNQVLSKRDYYLGILFCLVKKQYGFALDLAINAIDLFREPLFTEIKYKLISSLKGGNITVKSIKQFINNFIPHVFSLVFRKLRR